MKLVIRPILLIQIFSNRNGSSADYRRIFTHVESILLALLRLEAYKAVSTMTPMVDAAMVLPGKVPLYNFSTVSEFLDNLIGGYFVIDIVDIYLII